MISLINHDSQWGRSEVIIICPDIMLYTDECPDVLGLYIHLETPLFGKAGPICSTYALESHIQVKALKMQGFPNN